MRAIRIWPTPSRGNATHEGRPPEEWIEQKGFIELASVALSEEEFALLWHTPNGEYRTKKTASKLKLMGVKAGVPDIQWAMPIGQYHGLFIEMKSRSKAARATPAEKEMLARLKNQGYAVAICHGQDEAFEVLTRYKHNQFNQEEHQCGQKTGKYGK